MNESGFFESLIVRTIECLNETTIDYCIVGAIAASYYGSVRSTEDLDVIINLTTTDVKQIKHIVTCLQAKEIDLTERDLVQGLKEKGLEYLDDVKKEFGLKVVTEVLNTNTINLISNVADIIQIGARNMQNFALLEEVGNTGIPVLLKRGMSATVEDLLLSAEYILAQNNYKVILCERGIRTFETSTRNTLDLNAVPVIKKQSHLPMIVDPSHGIGIREHIPQMALAAVASGADGLIIETHNNPSKALSDGSQSLTLEKLKELIDRLKLLAPLFNKELQL